MTLDDFKQRAAAIDSDAFAEADALAIEWLIDVFKDNRDDLAQSILKTLAEHLP